MTKRKRRPSMPAKRRATARTANPEVTKEQLVALWEAERTGAHGQLAKPYVRIIATTIVDDPRLLLNADYHPYVHAALEWLLELTPRNQPFTPKEVAQMVDAEIAAIEFAETSSQDPKLIAKPSVLATARATVAHATGKSDEAVKQMHLREKRKRDKTR